MKGAKYILTAAVIAMSSVMMTGCFKPSKDAVVESKYYQSLKAVSYTHLTLPTT